MAKNTYYMAPALFVVWNWPGEQVWHVAQRCEDFREASQIMAKVARDHGEWDVRIVTEQASIETNVRPPTSKAEIDEEAFMKP